MVFFLVCAEIENAPVITLVKIINENNFLKSKFAWQEGYGAFSYSKSHIGNVIKYIQNQEQHHKKISFLDEYRSFLDAFDIKYDRNHIFIEPM